MLCDHQYIRRYTRPDVRTNKPKIVWICKYCGNIDRRKMERKNYETVKGE